MGSASRILDFMERQLDSRWWAVVSAVMAGVFAVAVFVLWLKLAVWVADGTLLGVLGFLPLFIAGVVIHRLLKRLADD